MVDDKVNMIAYFDQIKSSYGRFQPSSDLEKKVEENQDDKGVEVPAVPASKRGDVDCKTISEEASGGVVSETGKSRSALNHFEKFQNKISVQDYPDVCFEDADVQECFAAYMIANNGKN